MGAYEDAVSAAALQQLQAQQGPQAPYQPAPSTAAAAPEILPFSPEWAQARQAAQDAGQGPAFDEATRQAVQQAQAGGAAPPQRPAGMVQSAPFDLPGAPMDTGEAIQNAPQAPAQQHSLQPLPDGTLVINGPQGPMHFTTNSQLIDAAQRGLIPPDVLRQAAGHVFPEPGTQRPQDLGGGGRLTVAGSTTLHSAVSPETQAALGLAGQGVASAQQGVDAANVNRLSMAADATNQMATQQQQAAQQAAQAQQAQEQQLQQSWGRFEEARNRVATQQIDPEGFFGGQGGFGRRMGAVLAVALGSLGAAASGGPNQALGIINASIERNLQAQQANAQNTRESARLEGQALQQMQSVFRDQNAARDAARALHLEALARRLDGQMAGAEPGRLVAMQQLRDALMAQSQVAQQAALERERVTVTESWQSEQRVSPAVVNQVTNEALAPAGAQEAPAAPQRPQESSTVQRARARARARREAAGGQQGAQAPVVATVPGQGPLNSPVANAIQSFEQVQQPTQSQAQVLEFGNPADTRGNVTSQDLQRRVEGMTSGAAGEGTIPRIPGVGVLPGYEQAALDNYRDPQVRRTIIGLARSNSEFQRAARDWLQLRREFGAERLGTRARGRLIEAALTIQQTMRQRDNSGAMNSIGEIQRYEDIVPTDATRGWWNSWLGPNADQNLQQMDGLVQGIANGMEATANGYGLTLTTNAAEGARNTRAQR